MCIPAQLSMQRSLAAADTGDAADAVRKLFALHDATVPRDACAFGLGVGAAPDPAQPARLELSVRACEDGPLGAACRSIVAPAGGPVFFPADAGVRVVETHVEADRIALVLEREDGAAPRSVSGVLRVQGADGELHHLDVQAAAPARFAALHVLAMLALGVLGGLLLNLMPCVLPVLALKAFAVAELAGGGRRFALAHGVAYTGGILASMLALAAAVLALRAAGSEVGWGFQFQSPGFLVAISALCVAFALNLFGVFEIGFVPGGLASVGAGAQGARRSFFEGLLAVALATPCSAPFLGTAVGFAFASGGLLVAAVFLAIGLGLAAPFLLICAFPPAARWLPRSGRWMGELRGVLGFALLATVVWLVWVMGRSAGTDAAAGLLALLLVVAFVARLFGRLEQRRGLRAALLAAGVALVASSPNWITAESPASHAPETEIEATAWSPEAVASLREAGRPVLVVFTADWCLTCQMNESAVLDSEPVLSALAQGGWAVLEADWTRRDETIRRELARYGKAGVPLYLVYREGAAEPQVLPELLTVERMLTALADREPGHAQAVREADAS
jgi:thiol:disulfide interchange protein DsbD